MSDMGASQTGKPFISLTIRTPMKRPLLDGPKKAATQRVTTLRGSPRGLEYTHGSLNSGCLLWANKACIAECKNYCRDPFPKHKGGCNCAG